MPAGSPTSDKYVVYTVDTEDSSSGLEDGQIVFRDPDGINGLKRMPLRSLSSDSWGTYWSKREKCCCLWNVFLILVVICLAIVFIVMHKTLTDQQSEPDNSSMVHTASGHPDVADRRVTPAPLAPRETICSSHDCVRLAGSILSHMDTDVDPCEDFYEYSCGGFKKMAYLTWEAPRVRENPDILLTKYEDFLKDRLSAPSDPSVSRHENKLKTIYRACLWRRSIPLGTIRSAIQDLVNSQNTSQQLESNEFRLTQLVAMVTRNFGASPFFKVMVDRNQKISIINNYSDDVIREMFDDGEIVSSFRHLMPSDFYYRDHVSDQTMQSYKSFFKMTAMTILDAPEGDKFTRGLIDNLDSVFELEVSLNKNWYKDERRNNFKSIENCESRMNISRLQDKFPRYGISWELYFKLLLGDSRNVTGGTELCAVDLSPSIQGVIARTDSLTLIHYVWMHTLLHTDIFNMFADRTRPFNLSTSIYNIPKHSNDEAMCIAYLSTVLPLSAIVTIPKLNVFEKESQMLFVNLKQTLIEVMDGLYWIPRHQREAVAAHMDNITLHFEWTKWKVLIGSGVLDISKLTGGYIDNMLEITRTKHKLYLTGIKIYPTWRMSISKFVKKYQSVELSASAIQGPSFYSPATVPVTYGSTGVLIAQTLVKAFDIDALLLHFMTGLIDRRVLFTMAHHLQCMIDTFDRYSLIDTQGARHQVRGDLTKGDNFRDTLALHVAFRAYRRSFDRGYDRMVLPGLNLTDHQLFFVTYTQTMCEKVNARGVELYYMDINNPELPRYIKVHGSLSNFPKFSAAYKCPKKSPMNSDSKCIVL
ncbi:membrane metallo-endopeptidase-like 1 [Mizuhopecten yessoensis]|uniref:Membrane metallo-endopeptidase-like 1 n=1 Tax=Mizuhopecten yessoensis TaxID=6573 RepID=A0A210QCH4_MIZYE|nr:membrane metallo-endopeptidase-like 1 [Mizuhopecten yessoensis]OWF46456.1 Membrane metallo-endopeptidase-like 1 [Mizuhopecten yessoensis]